MRWLFKLLQSCRLTELTAGETAARFDVRIIRSAIHEL